MAVAVHSHDASQLGMCVAIGKTVLRGVGMNDFNFGVYNSPSPCTKCEDRTMICHSQCQKYKDWREALEKKKQEVYDKRNMEAQTDLYVKSQTRARGKYAYKCGGKKRKIK